MDPGDTLLLYTDGLTETRDGAQGEYGVDRLTKFLSEHHGRPPRLLLSDCVNDLSKYCSGRPAADDMTIMAVRRVG